MEAIKYDEKSLSRFPVAEYELSEISMREFLHAKGFIDCKVTHSNIPYRG